MSTLSRQQYSDIMDSYARTRRENRLLQQHRQEEVYQLIPDIRRIDTSIAHISLETARYMVFHPEENKKEELHRKILDLSMEKVNLLVLHGYPADYLDPVYTCPDCMDTGFTGRKRCHCFRRRIADILCKQSNLSRILGRDSFASFRLDYYSDQPNRDWPVPPRDHMKEVLAQARAYTDSFDTAPGRNLLIYGSAGVGKSFLSHCIAGELLGQTQSVIYLTSYQFFHQLEENTFRRKEGDPDILPGLLACDLLIIDDLGTEMNNAFVNSQLFLCINERILARRSTIINTNLSLEQISRTYSERVFSRIVESYELIHIYGDDIRIKKAMSPLDE